MPTSLLLLAGTATEPGWGALPDRLREHDLLVLAVDTLDQRPPWPARAVAAAALTARGALASGELVGGALGGRLLLAGLGSAGPLLPALGAALRAQGHQPGGYLFLDSPVPRAGDGAPVVADWPDAPCGYLHRSADRAADARLARLRGWPVLVRPGPPDVEPSAADLLELVALL